MKKSDLKDGMIVQTEEDLYLVCGDKFLGLNGYMGFEDYDESLNLKDEEFEKYNINFVYKTKSYGLGLEELLSETKSLEKIWERPREIDWSKVPKWTKVQVKFPGEIEWENYLFTDYLPNNVFKFHVAGFKDDEFTGYEATRHQVEYCRIHESVEIKEEWYR